LADDLTAEIGLHLIGTGAGTPLNMTVGGRKTAMSCQHRFLEGYTSLLGDGGESLLEKLVGSFEILRRPAIEMPELLLQLAQKSSVALLVIGDPMQATTHVDLLLRCKDAGINTSVHHAVSAIDLVCAGIGLQSYRFGRQVTLTFPHGRHLPTSPLEMLAENLFLGLHTLVLLDLDPTGMGIEHPRPMSPREAVEVLREMDRKLRDEPPPHLDSGSEDYNERMKVRISAIAALQNVGIDDLHGVLCSNLGSTNSSICSGRLSELASEDNNGIHSLVVTGNLSEIERDALERLRP